MIHYYFFKYWSRGLVGLMITFVVGYFSLFSYSLFAVHHAEQTAAEAAMLSVTPEMSERMLTNPQTQNSYKKSLQVFGEIQKLKEKHKDTSKLETMFADSVKTLTSENPKGAETTLEKIEKEIATINQSLTGTPTPIPSGVETTVTVSPSESPNPSAPVDPSGSPIASASGE